MNVDVAQVCEVYGSSNLEFTNRGFISTCRQFLSAWLFEAQAFGNNHELCREGSIMDVAAVCAGLPGSRIFGGDLRGTVDSGCSYQARGVITAAIHAGVHAFIDASVLACCNTASVEAPHPQAELMDRTR